MDSKRAKLRSKRTMRVRKKLRGTHPRLLVLKTNQHIHVQLIDDEKQATLASTSTMSKEFKGCKKSKESAQKLGSKIAELALAKDVKAVVFDRGCQKYHGILKALADGARSGGLKF